MQAFRFIPISHAYHFIALTNQPSNQNNSLTNISEEQESLTSTTSSSKQDISEAQEYSNEKAERVSLPHKQTKDPTSI